MSPERKEMIVKEHKALRAALAQSEESFDHLERLISRAEDAVSVLCQLSAHPGDAADVAAGMLAGAADRASAFIERLHDE